MLKIEEKNKVEETLKDSIKLKTKECEKLEKEVKKLKAETKVHKCNKLLDDLIDMQKPHKHKVELGFETDECSNQKDKAKEVKVEEERKLEVARNI